MDKTDIPPFILTIQEKEYHAASEAGEYLSSHNLADFRTCPAIYKAKKDGLIPRTSSEAFAVGSAAHCLILEGVAVFNERYMVTDGPVNPKTGKPFGRETNAFREWAAGIDKPMVSNEEFASICGMADAIDAHECRFAIQYGIPEAVVRTNYAGRPCQIRMDNFACRYDKETGTLGGLSIIDLKTCQDIDSFERDARWYGYAYQLAFYRSVLAAASGVNEDAIETCIIAVEKKAPYRVGYWTYLNGALHEATVQNEIAIENLKQAETSDTWPTGYETMRTLCEIS